MCAKKFDVIPIIYAYHCYEPIRLLDLTYLFYNCHFTTMLYNEIKFPFMNGVLTLVAYNKVSSSYLC